MKGAIEIPVKLTWSDAVFFQAAIKRLCADEEMKLALGVKLDAFFEKFQVKEEKRLQADAKRRGSTK